MNRSQSIIQKYYEENSSINNLGETPKGVIDVDKDKKKKKIKTVLNKYEKYLDTYLAKLTAKKRMEGSNIQVEEGMMVTAFITEIPESQTFDITLTGKECNIFKYENKEEAEKDWEII